MTVLIIEKMHIGLLTEVKAFCALFNLWFDICTSIIIQNVLNVEVVRYDADYFL
jgi:hypothetical protein